jgi:hypothetical protein
MDPRNPEQWQNVIFTCSAGDGEGPYGVGVSVAVAVVVVTTPVAARPHENRTLDNEITSVSAKLQVHLSSLMSGTEHERSVRNPFYCKFLHEKTHDDGFHLLPYLSKSETFAS